MPDEKKGPVLPRPIPKQETDFLRLKRGAQVRLHRWLKAGGSWEAHECKGLVHAVHVLGRTKSRKPFYQNGKLVEIWCQDHGHHLAATVWFEEDQTLAKPTGLEDWIEFL